jgi:hypothetical protein
MSLLRISELCIRLNKSRGTVEKLRKTQWTQGVEYFNFGTTDTPSYSYDLEAILSRSKLLVPDKSLLSNQSFRVPTRNRLQI